MVFPAFKPGLSYPSGIKVSKPLPVDKNSKMTTYKRPKWYRHLKWLYHHDAHHIWIKYAVHIQVDFPLGIGLGDNHPQLVAWVREVAIQCNADLYRHTFTNQQRAILDIEVDLVAL